VALAVLFLNPDLKAKRAEKGVADAQLITAGMWPNPDFDGKLQRDTKQAGWAIEANLAFEVLRWQERAAEREAARANIEAVHADVLAEEWRMVCEARAAYWSVIGLRAKLQINQDSLSLADRLEKAAQARLGHGATDGFELNLAKLDRLKVQSELLKVEAELSVAERQLRQLIGLPPNAELKLRTGQDYTSPQMREWRLDELVALLPESARMKTLEWKYQVAEGELRKEIVRQFPSLKLGPSGEFSFDGSAWSSLLGTLVQFELPFLHRNGGPIKEKLAARNTARAAYAAQLHALRGDLADAIGRTSAVQKQIAFYRGDMLPSVNESIRLTESSVKAGQLDMLALLKAQSSVIEAKAAYYDTLLEYRRNLQSVETALGRRLDDVINAKPQPDAKAPSAQPDTDKP
jgi:outer membrane protein TolC